MSRLIKSAAIWFAFFIAATMFSAWFVVNVRFTL